MSFNVGENVGPYRIVEQLGQGGMATVYKAFHAALDRYVALKALHPAFGEDPEFQGTLPTRSPAGGEARASPYSSCVRLRRT